MYVYIYIYICMYTYIHIYKYFLNRQTENSFLMFCKIHIKETSTIFTACL